MMNNEKGKGRENIVNSNDKGKHSECGTGSPAFDAARKTLGNGYAFLQSYPYAVKAIAEMSYKIIEDLEKDGGFGQKKNQEREDQYNQLEKNKAEEQYKLFTKRMDQELINQQDPFYATHGTTFDGLLKDIENDRKRNYIDLSIDDSEQFHQNIQSELEKEIKRLKTDKVPKYPLGDVWSTQSLDNLPIEPNKDLPVGLNTESTQESNEEMGAKASSSQQDTSGTDVERKNRLKAKLRTLSLGRTPNLGELPSVAGTLLRYYNTKSSSSKSYFEKQKTYWEEQKSNAIRIMDNMTTQMKNSKEYQELMNTRRDLEALDTN